jgi:DNA-binding response OmpR family regulator
MLRPDPAQEPRLLAIIVTLDDRPREATKRGWLGEVDGLKVSLDAAHQKLAQMRTIRRQPGQLTCRSRQAVRRRQDDPPTQDRLELTGSEFRLLGRLRRQQNDPLNRARRCARWFRMR